MKIILCGANGRMGQVICSIVDKSEKNEIVAKVDTDFDFSEITSNGDVIIDFSNPSSLDDLLKYATQNKIPVVLATTGYSDEQLKKIEDSSKLIPIFKSANMSLGVNLIANLASKAAKILKDDFDIEIIEAHHNQKLDAPSGTALLIADKVNNELSNKMNYEYDRHTKYEKREKSEIGIHSVRGGTIVGEHEIIFAGPDEIVKISHSARSREIFANGAIKSAEFLIDKNPGIYDMNDLLEV
ncbi:MAG: 4-hydroxy-tetrahydrodipicolinate reductase [Clostridia bacterium]|nr:4-hydroxy-tetrahydrodipicolinate reductase [Clostridia bacterium]